MVTTEAITGNESVLDSRDIIARIEHLKEEFTVDLDDSSDVDRMSNFDFEEIKELAQLLALQAEAEGYAPDWQHGCTLVHEDHFTEYAQEMAYDIGAISKDATWPACHIDWEAAAEALKVDYTEVEFGTQTYLVR
jgi:hypothetical protein